MNFDARALPLLQNTAVLAVAVMVIALPVALVLAILLNRFELPARRCWETVLLLLLFMPLYNQVAAWEAGFGRAGWYSSIVNEKLSSPPLEGFGGAMWVHAMWAVPWVFWLIRLGLTSMPPGLETAASLDGSVPRVLARITLPRAVPALIGGALFVLISAATEITVTDVYQVRTFAEELYTALVLGSDFAELPFRVAPLLLLMSILVFSGLGIGWFIGARFESGWTEIRFPTRGMQRWIALAIVLLLLTMVAVVPLGNLIYQAGIDVRQVGDARERYWSLQKMLEILFRSPLRYQRELAWSVLLGNLSSITSIAGALATAVWAGARVWRQSVAVLLAVTIFVLPGPFIGLGIIGLLNRPDSSFCRWLYDDTLAPPWLALSLRAFPLTYLVIWFGYRSLPRRTLEAARLEGAGPMTLFCRVKLPQLWPALLCAFAVSMAICVADLSASVLVIPPGVTTVASRIFNLVHYGAEDELAGLCLTSMAMMWILAVATWFVGRRMFGHGADVSAGQV